MKNIKRINHISYTVDNLERSINFYVNTLGLELIDKSERESSFASKATGFKNAHLKIAYLKADAYSLELVEYIYPKGKKLDTSTNNVGSSHICFEVDNIRSLVGKIKEKGGVVKSKPIRIPAGPNKGRYMVYVKDLDGNNLELISQDLS